MDLTFNNPSLALCVLGVAAVLFSIAFERICAGIYYLKPNKEEK